MFKNVTKADLILVLQEIGEETDSNLRVVDLKELLLKSKEYLKDKEFVIEYLTTIVTERKNGEEANRLRLQQNMGNDNSSHNEGENTSISLDKLIKAVQVLVIPVPKRNETWNLFFDSLERAFKHKNVPKEFKSEILLKLIGEKAKNVLVYISNEDLSDYDKIKSLILKEYEPSPSSCLENFKNARRFPGETHQQFASRLRSCWLHYCRIRNVKDFDSLINLIISDKLLATLDSELSTHIAVKQGESWFLPDQLSKDCDIYFTAKGRSFEETKFEKRSVYREIIHENSKYVPPQLRKNQMTSENKHFAKPRECYICNSTLHMAKLCPNRRIKFDKFNRQNDDHTQRKNKSQDDTNKMYSKENAVVSHVNSRHLRTNDQLNEIKFYPLKKIIIYIGGKAIEAIIDSGTELCILNTSLIPDLKLEAKGRILLESAFKEKIQADLATIPIHYKLPNSEIFVTSYSLFALTEDLNVPCLITPDVYNTLLELENDPLRNSNILQEAENRESINSLTGATEMEMGGRSNNNLRPQTVEKKNNNGELSELSVFSSSEINSQIETKIKVCHQTINNEKRSDVYFISAEDKQNNENEFSEHHKFRNAQKECLTLKNSFKDASLKKNNFLMRDNLLFHKETICGDKIYQLVLPESYRNKVLELAHDSIFGNHLGMRKTKERIKLSFYWPNISRDVELFCRTCKNCQLRSPEKQTDKIPITPVVRAPYPFHTVNIDIIGEIVPSSGRKHKYCLCLIDQNSKWPEVVPLRNLSAKTTCDALLEIFMRTGIPEIICSDQGTNFTSQLTKEFENRLGTCPRFSTPLYPASNGLVEKFNRVFKQMLHHVIRTDPVNWDKHIPFLLFAYREVPNCTTGVSPFKLMYGREARGPLAVLKSSWSGEIPLPLNLSNSAVDYLQELKINLERAADLASLTAAEKQETYAHYFNRRSKMKEFEKGDLVYLLIPDSTNKLYARWTGPSENKIAMTV